MILEHQDPCQHHYRTSNLPTLLKLEIIWSATVLQWTVYFLLQTSNSSVKRNVGKLNNFGPKSPPSFPIQVLQNRNSYISIDQIVLAVIHSHKVALRNKNAQHEAHPEFSATVSLHSFSKGNKPYHTRFLIKKKKKLERICRYAVTLAGT